MEILLPCCFVIPPMFELPQYNYFSFLTLVGKLISFAISPDAAIGTVTRIREEDCTVCSRFYSAWEQRGGCGGGGGCERGRGSVRSFVCLLSRMGELILLRRREAIDLRLRSGLEM